jgi:hypothetical protein
MPIRRGDSPAKKLDHLAAAKRLPDDDLLRRINAVHLEHVHIRLWPKYNSEA